ncbi:TonB-dependent receptor [Neotamlana sedimentorum]|uniref:TonB-dependent receptor n=1 Tax=Neotamlana sedimentorum TaxID=1435349 RepID=UPI0005CBF50A|nr:TonB-dependent receptor [Tamlana sedimentorum]
MKTFYLFVLQFICFFGIGYGQNQEYQLSLQVLNQKTGTPMENVNIFIEPCSCGGVTNSRGEFSINLPKNNNYQVVLTYIGFKDKIKHVQLDKNMKLDVKLIGNDEQLSEVIVNAKRVNDNLESPQMGTIQLKAEDLNKIPAAAGEFDILRGVTLLAGVNNSGEISNGLSVRGSSLDQNLILYDHAPIFNPTHLFGLFSVFTPDVISNVDLYRANIPARYGGRTSSVLGVKVKNPYVSQFKLSGGVGLVSSRLALETPIIKDKLMLIAGGRAGLTDFLLPIFSKRLNNTKARFYDGTIKLLYLPTDKDQIAITSFYSKDFYQLDLISSVENIVAETNQYDFKTLNGTLNWLHTFNNSTNLRTILVSSNYRPRNIFPEIDSTNEIEFESKINYLSLVTEFTKKVSNTFDYYAGIQSNQYKISPGKLNVGSSNTVLPILLPTETSYDFSGYANANLKPFSNLTLSAGLRYNYFCFQGPYTLNTYDDAEEIIETEFFGKGEKVNDYNNLEPRLGLNLKLNDNISIKASYSSVHQYLQNIYNSTTPIPTSRWKASDPYVKPQSSNAYSLGVYKNFDNNKIEMSIEGYYRATNNHLTYKPGADFFLEKNLEQFVVQGKGKAYGVELSLKKAKGKLNGWINYTWSKSLLRTENNDLGDRVNNNQWYNSDFDRPHVFNATLNFKSDKYNTLRFNFTGQSGRPYTIANGNFDIQDITVPIYLERNNSRLPTYHRLDFAWNINVSKNKNRRLISDWTFTIYNVYGRKNPFNKYYAQRNGEFNEVFSNNPLGSYELLVTNSPVFSLTYNFKFQ